MDPLGALYAAVAVLVFPGAAYLAAVATGVARAGGLPDGPPRLDPGAAGALIAATLVASLAPLPGSLLESVPPERGVAQNLAGALGLLTAALIAASGRVPWTRVRVAAAVFMLEALAALAIGAASLSLPLVAGTPGAGREAARWCAAAAVLLSLPAVAMPFATGSSRLARAALMTAALLLALSIAAPDWLAARPAPLEAGALAAAAIVYTLILRGLRGVLDARPAAVVVAAGACATATTVLCLIVARPG